MAGEDRLAGDHVDGRRSIEETLELAWKLLLSLPEADLKRLDAVQLARRRGEGRLEN